MTERIGNNDWRRTARIAIALATLLAGLVVLASGGAKIGADALQAVGLPSAAATTVAAAGAAVVPMAILFVVLVSAGVDRRFLRIGGAGSAIAILGVGVAVKSPTPFVDPLAVGTYGLGALLAVGALVGGTVAESTPSIRDRSTSGYRAQQSTRRITPADGGEEDDDDLVFPLEDED